MRRFEHRGFGAGQSFLLVLGLVAIFASAAVRAEETPSAAGTPGVAAKPAAATAENGPGCKEMQAASAAATARVEEKLKAVDAANGDAKVAAMADLLHELVAQHGAMRCGGGDACCAAGCCGQSKAAMEKCEMMHGHQGHGPAAGKGAGHHAHH